MQTTCYSTDRLQPLDVFYNRQTKSTINRAYNRVILDQLPIPISTRDNIIRLASLKHRRISAKNFQGLIRYAWHGSGYVDNHPGAFKTVNEVRLDIHIASCQITNCDQSSFIRCSWRDKHSYFNHRISFSLVILH